MRFRVAAFVLALGWFFACCACAEGDVSSEILEYALQARADLSAVGQGLDAGALFPEAGEFGGREAALIDFLREGLRKAPEKCLVLVGSDPEKLWAAENLSAKISGADFSVLGPALCLAPLSAAQELETGGVCCGLMDAYSLYDAFPCEWDFRLAYAIQIATLEEPILVTALYREETGAVFAKTQALIASQVDVLTAYLLANIEAFWGKDSFASTFYVRQEDGSFAKEARGF